MRVYRTSVKEDINVGNVFQHLAENYVHQWRLEQDLMRFDIGGGGPRSLAVCSPPSTHHHPRSSSASPTDCNGSTASSNSSGSGGGGGGGGATSSSSASSSRMMSHSVSSSGYFSLTDFGPPPSLRPSRYTLQLQHSFSKASVDLCIDRHVKH